MRDFTEETEVESMTIAVLSGKGGTGKTLISVNFAAALNNSRYIDCDVEEPNGHLFFKPELLSEKNIVTKNPTVNNSLCNGCKKCVDFCRFNALAYAKDKLLVFEEVCHFCGGCIIVCPNKALTEKERVIGKVQKGTAKQVSVYTGILNPGEASGIPIIKELLKGQKYVADKTIIVDCPPGSACIVMEAIKDADYCVLVAEPTLFGVHNFNMVYQLVKLFNKPFGAVLNKCLEGENPAEVFCIDNKIDILGKIPFDSKLGLLNSNAKIAVYENEEYKKLFLDLYQKAAQGGMA